MDEEAIFAAALEYETPEQRQAFVEQACAGDAKLQALVEGLLQAHDHPDSFLQASAANLVATVDDPIQERPGTAIGPYKLLEEIGEGGMGLVFVAEQQQPIKRRVALKVIKPGMDSRQVIARFEAERQALAMMDHPHIAKVHDGGTTPEGRPYFVMELVKGTPITDYCDRHCLTTRQRLALFLDVCHAVQHAHQKGIIHRDLKPSNVLVEVHDVEPVVKVIDFGVAKATGQQLTDKTLYTALAQMVGTPMYMSPEQAGLSSLDVDTRSDVYSLGVLLYELLTGTTPFDSETLKKASYDEMRRIICEEEPPRPSTRLSTMQQAALSTIAERHGMEPRRLSQQLRGELDWIVMKALEKDRNRRYESATTLAADVQRYLDDEPVQACPPSAGYRFRKFARRNKVALVTAGVVAAALVIGTAVSVWQAVEADAARQLAGERADKEEQARRNAEAHFQKALKAVKQMLLEVGDANVAAIPQLKEMRERLMEDAIALYTDLIASNPRNSQAYYQRGEAYARLRKLQQGRDDFEKAIEIDPENVEALRYLTITLWLVSAPKEKDRITRPYVRRVLELQPTKPESHHLAATMHAWMGRPKEAAAADRKAAELAPPGSAEAYSYLVEADLSVNDLRAAKENCKKWLAIEPSSPDAHHGLGRVYESLGEYDQALTAFNKALESTQVPSWKLMEIHHHRGNSYLALKNYAAALSDYSRAIELMSDQWYLYQRRAKAHFYLKHYEEALADIAKAVELRPDDLNTYIQRAECHEKLGQLDEAEADYSALIALAADEKDRIAAYDHRCKFYECVGRPEKARQDVARMIQLAEQWREKKAKATPDAEDLHFMNQVGFHHNNAGRWHEAIAVLKPALEEYQSVLGPDDERTLTAMHNLATAYRGAGRLSEALALLEQKLEKTKGKLGPDHPTTLGTINDLAVVYVETGRLAKGVPLFEETLKLTKAKLGPDHPDTLISMNNLASGYHNAGKLDLALPLLEETLKLTKAKLGPDHPDTLRSMNNLASAYLDAGKLDQVGRLGRELLARRRKKDGPKSADTANALAILSSNLVKQKKYAEAEPLLRERMAIRKETLPAEHWLNFGDRLALGEVLLGQQKYAEAEPLLLQGYGGMKEREAKLPPLNKKWLTETVERIVHLYEAAKQPEKARTWREKLPSGKHPGN